MQVTYDELVATWTDKLGVEKATGAFASGWAHRPAPRCCKLAAQHGRAGPRLRPSFLFLFIYLFSAVPFIQKPDGTFLMDSWEIMQWLDAAYPDQPAIYLPAAPTPVDRASEAYQHAVARTDPGWTRVNEIAVPVYSKVFALCESCSASCTEPMGARASLSGGGG